jgi:hypothetical protein
LSPAKRELLPVTNNISEHMAANQLRGRMSQATTRVLDARTHSGDVVMDYTLETATRLAKELRAIPPKDPAKRKLDKQGFVKHLAQEIVALQQRGYTIEEVAESLRGRGLDITTPTLRNYLQRAKSGTENRSKARPRVAGPAATTGAPKAAKAEAPAKPAPAVAAAAAPVKHAPTAPPAMPVPESAALRSGKGAFLIKDKDSY